MVKQQFRVAPPSNVAGKASNDHAKKPRTPPLAGCVETIGGPGLTGASFDLGGRGLDVDRPQHIVGEDR